MFIIDFLLIELYILKCVLTMFIDNKVYSFFLFLNLN